MKQRRRVNVDGAGYVYGVTLFGGDPSNGTVFAQIK